MRIAAGMIVLAGCASTPPVSFCGPVTLDALDGRLAAAVCGCDTGLARLALGHVPGDCVAEMTAFYADGEVGHLRASVAAGVAFRPDLAQAAVCFYVACVPGSFAEAAVRLGVGASADGGACANQDDCSMSSTCTIGSGCGGMCLHRPQLGEACSFNSDCRDPIDAEAPRLWCVHGACAAVPGSGESCTPDGGCSAGLTCQVMTGSAGGTCVGAPPPISSGGSCVVSCPMGFSSCPSTVCAPGLLCVDGGADATRICSPVLTDGTCRARYGGASSASDCALGSSCMGASGGTRGTCTPPPSEGQPCTSVLAPCGPGLRCAGSLTGGTCRRLGRVGAGCRSDQECLSYYCDAGSCATPPACH